MNGSLDRQLTIMCWMLKLNGSIWLLRGKKATCRDLWSWNGITYDWSVDILLCKSLYHIVNSARGQDDVNPVFWLATWAGMMGPPSHARDSAYWSHARKLTKFITFGRCWHAHRKKQTTLLGLLCCKHSWLSLSALKINRPFLILIKAKSFAIQWIL